MTSEPDQLDDTDDAALSGRDRHDVMHHEIRQRICLLSYPPGERLSEVALAHEFGTSRTPIRRVLARLEDEGLVQSQHGVGTLVTDANITELEQVYHLRLELTEMTGRLNPVMPDEAYLKRFAALVAQGAEIIRNGTPHAFTKFDIDVFQTLLDLTANEPLRQTLERLYYQTKRIWLKSAIEAHLDLEEEFRIFHHELEAIQLALEAGDLQAAAHIQRAHISMSFQRLQKQNA